MCEAATPPHAQHGLKPHPLETQETFLDLLAVQQIEDIKHGTPPSNAVAVNRLSSNDRARLRTALKAVQHLDELTRDLLFET